MSREADQGGREERAASTERWASPSPLGPLHGPGPYDKLNGYKVVRVKFANGKPTGAYEDFLTGFLRTGEGRLDLLGQPAGLAMAKDGSLLVADDLGGVIWRVTYRAAH